MKKEKVGQLSDWAGRFARNSVAMWPIIVVMLGGCAAYTVIDTTVSTVGTIVETTADVASGVAGGAVDLVVGEDDDDDAKSAD